jgi:hypothetical protein
MEDVQPLALSQSEKFAIEKFCRDIDAEPDHDKVRAVAKQLVSAFYNQKAATRWTMSHKLPAPFKMEAPKKKKSKNKKKKK